MQWCDGVHGGLVWLRSKVVEGKAAMINQNKACRVSSPFIWPHNSLPHLFYSSCDINAFNVALSTTAFEVFFLTVAFSPLVAPRPLRGAVGSWDTSYSSFVHTHRQRFSYGIARRESKCLECCSAFLLLKSIWGWCTVVWSFLYGCSFKIITLKWIK